MRTPAETRAFYPAGPGTVYDLMFCDGVKVCDDVERISFLADCDDDAVGYAREAMRSRPAHEVGGLSREVGRGHGVWVADIADSGAHVEADDCVSAAHELHRDRHGCGTGGAR
jgi:hypothetical protein